MTDLKQSAPSGLDSADPYRVALYTDRQKFFLGFVGLTIVVASLLCALRITTSSLIFHGGTGDPNTARLIAGQPRQIRADEWNRSTPDQLGSLTDGWTPNYRSIFEVRISHSGFVEWVANFLQAPERFLAQWVLSVNAFFPLWWLPIVMALSAMTGVFLLWGFGRIASASGAALVVLIPTASWWSYHPLEIIWPLLTAFVFIEMARRIAVAPIADQPGQTGRMFPMLSAPKVTTAISVLLAIVGGVIASRIPFGYFPWVVPSAVIYLCLVLDWMLWKGVFRNGFRPYLIGLVTLIVCAAFKGFVWLTRYQALASTVYPGQRRSTDGNLGEPLFTGAQAGYLQSELGKQLVGTNQSEAALGPLVFVVVVVLLTMFAISRFGARSLTKQGVPLLSVGAVGVLLAWALVPWPSFLLWANPLTLLPTYRVGQIIGVIGVVPAIIALVKMVEMVSTRSRIGIAAMASTFTLIVSVAGGVSLSKFMPELSVDQIWLTSAMFSLCTGIAIAFSSRTLFLLPLLGFFAMSSFRINPIVQGLGDLRDSRVASDLRDLVLPASSSERIASDDFQLDSLVVANGLPMASGQVSWGPNDAIWHLLDPDDRYEESWNRGASSLRFDWQDDTESPVIWSPFEDMIIVTIDQCSPILKELGVGWIISSRPLRDECVNEKYQFRWLDGDRWLYQVS